MATIEKRKRVNLTVSQKLELIKKLESGVSVKEVCEEYGVKKQTVSDIRKQKEKLVEYSLKYSVEKTSVSLVPRKHMKVGNQKELDEAVLKWCEQQKACGNKLTSGSIRSACERLSTQLGVQCSASEGWLWRFRNRYALCNRSVKDEGETDIDWTDDPEMLSKEEMAAEVMAVQYSSSSEDEDGLPELSEVRNAVDLVLKFVQNSKNKDISGHYDNLKKLREIIIREELSVGKLDTKSTPSTSGFVAEPQASASIGLQSSSDSE